MNKWKARFKESLILGLLTLAPLVITLWLLGSIVGFLDSLFYQFVPVYNNSTELFGVPVPGVGIVATFVLLVVAGGLARTFAGKWLQGFSDWLLSRLPLVSGLYKMTKQISAVFFSQSPKAAFHRVAYVPFPSDNSRSLAFVASETDDGHTFVFVPTAPNPTSGYVLRYRNDQIEPSSMTIDAALQMVLSCGALGSGPQR